MRWHSAAERGEARLAGAVRCGPGSRGIRHGEAGSVTAEFAAVVPAALLVLACCLGGLQLCVQQARVQDAAAAAARSLARGDPLDVSRLVAGASATSRTRGELACVSVTAPGPLLAGLLGAVPVTASSCALAGGR